MERAFILLLLVGTCVSLSPFPGHWGYDVTKEKVQRCPNGFFALEDEPQCFKVLLESKGDWAHASSRCRDQGLDLAQPSPQSVVALNNLIHDKHGDANVWVGARRHSPDGEVVWEKQGQNPTTGIPRSSQLWGYYGDFAGGYNCVAMYVYAASFGTDTPYGLEKCTRSYYFPLCQATTLVIAETTAVTTTKPPVPDCPSPWVLIGNECFFVFAEQPGRRWKSWSSARNYCQALARDAGSDLAQPNNINALAKHLLETPATSGLGWWWLGGSDPDHSGDWYWLNGTMIASTQWNRNEPGGAGNCLQMWSGPTDTGRLWDKSCDAHMTFVCQRY